MKAFSLLSIVMLLFMAASEVLATELRDVTKEWTFQYRVISAFPETYKVVPKEENADIIRVFHYFQGDAADPSHERRIEVFYTGGDWMEFGMVYFVTNSPNPRFNVYSDESAAYFMADLSTTDSEDGEIPPKVDPLDEGAIRQFILDSFLDAEGNVRPDFSPLAPGS